MDVRESKTSSNFVSIFPNTVVDYLIVDFCNSGDATLELSTIHGQTVASYNLSATRNKVSLSDLPAGLYVIRIE